MRTALNSDMAIRAIHDRKPGLIFMDINMPGKSGLETLKEVQGLIPGVPVVMITACGEQDEVMDARRQDLIQHYLTKPFDIIFLIQMVRKIMSPASGLVRQKAAGL